MKIFKIKDLNKDDTIEYVENYYLVMHIPFIDEQTETVAWLQNDICQIMGFAIQKKIVFFESKRNHQIYGLSMIEKDASFSAYEGKKAAYEARNAIIKAQKEVRRRKREEIKNV